MPFGANRATFLSYVGITLIQTVSPHKITVTVLKLELDLVRPNCSTGLVNKRTVKVVGGEGVSPKIGVKLSSPRPSRLLFHAATPGSWLKTSNFKLAKLFV